MQNLSLFDSQLETFQVLSKLGLLDCQIWQPKLPRHERGDCITHKIEQQPSRQAAKNDLESLKIASDAAIFKTTNLTGQLSTFPESSEEWHTGLLQSLA